MNELTNFPQHPSRIGGSKRWRNRRATNGPATNEGCMLPAVVQEQEPYVAAMAEEAEVQI